MLDLCWLQSLKIVTVHQTLAPARRRVIEGRVVYLTVCLPPGPGSQVTWVIRRHLKQAVSWQNEKDMTFYKEDEALQMTFWINVTEPKNVQLNY